MSADLNIGRSELGGAMRRRLLTSILSEALHRGVTVRAREPVPAETPNARVASARVLLTAQLTSVGNWISKKAEDTLHGLENALASAVEKADPEPGATEADLEPLFAAAAEAVAAAYHGLLLEVRADLAKAAAVVARRVKGHIEEHHGATGGRVRAPREDLPVVGLTLEEHVDKQAADTLTRFKAAVRTGLGAGEGAGALVARLRGETTVQGRKAAHCPPGGVIYGTRARGQVQAADPEAVRTALQVAIRLMDPSENSLNKVIQAAIQMFGNAAADGEAGGADSEREMGWQWAAVMDQATCDQCEFYDGSQWDADMKPVGDAPEYPGDAPLHYGCRCSLVPVDLGAEPVPERSFEDYLSDFSRKEQEAAFGVENLRAYRRGDITPNQLVGQRSNLMTLEKFAEGLR